MDQRGRARWEPAPGGINSPGETSSGARLRGAGTEPRPSNPPVLGFTRAKACYAAQFGMQPHEGLSNWETTFPEGTRSFNFCNTASMQMQDLEGIRKISYVISSLFLERRQKSKRKQNRASPGIHKEETKNMINRLDHYFLKMTYCSSCYISRFLLSLRIKSLAGSK